jgi:hypothetical protein
MSAPASVYTLGPTLNTVYTYNPADNTVTATWTADPTAVSYSVFYYDWASGTWMDGADTTGTSATVSGWSPDVYVSFYIAAYDVDGVETDYDQQMVSVQAPPPRRETNKRNLKERCSLEIGQNRPGSRRQVFQNDSLVHWLASVKACLSHPPNFETGAQVIFGGTAGGGWAASFRRDSRRTLMLVIQDKSQADANIITPA